MHRPQHLLAALWLAGCSLDTGTFAGKTCASNVECPPPYVCAQVRPDARTCELVRGIDTGPGQVVAPGVVVDYCHDAQKILARTCVSNCHGTVNTGSMRTDFRLDQYGPAGAVNGAFAMAARIQIRTQDDSMPPITDTVNPRTTADEKATLAAWVSGGAVECVDAGSPHSTDGGTDGGG